MGNQRLLQPTLRFSPRFPPFLGRSLGSYHLPLSRSLRFPGNAAGTLSTFLVLSYLLADSGRVRDDGNGGEGGGGCKVDGAAGPFGYVLALQLSRWTASCATSYILNYVSEWNILAREKDVSIFGYKNQLFYALRGAFVRKYNFNSLQRS